MGKDSVRDFVIESKGRCFFCLEQISPVKGKSECSTVHSLQYLSRLLRMDRRKVFTDCQSGDIPSHLLAKVDRSILKAHLCAECASANETLTNLCRRLEKIEMDVMHTLDHIYRKLLKKATVTSRFDKSTDNAAESENEWNAKQGILNALREDAIYKCSNKLKDNSPRLKIHCLTARDIHKKKRKCILSSSKGPRSLKPDSSRDVKHEPINTQAMIKTELDESIADTNWDNHDFDIETRSTSPSDNWQAPPTVERVSRQLSLSLSVPSQGQRPRQVQRHNGPKISENMEIIKSVGNLSTHNKFRCKQCGKLFNDRRNTARHIKGVHMKERKFRCTQCPKTFSQGSSLQRHVMAHSGTKQYSCKLCEKAYSDRWNLNKHERRVHTGNAPRQPT